MKEVLLHRLADDEINAQAAYYERFSQELGRVFLAEVERAFDRILEHPDIGAPIGVSVRKLQVGRFPHDVIYGPSPQGGIFVVAVAHHRRDPGYWRGRFESV